MLHGAALVELGLPRAAAFSPTVHLSASTQGASAVLWVSDGVTATPPGSRNYQVQPQTY